MGSEWRIARAVFAVSAGRLDAMERFYVRQLGLHGARSDDDLRVTIGEVELRFAARAGQGEPFYHFALLVPGNRFAAARDWLAAHAALLSRPGSGETVFEFGFWDARACYAHDPASNIVELIAHRGIEESPDAAGDFSAAELRGLSEVGIVVTDLPAAADRLRSAGLRLWFGQVTDQRRGLGFVGRQAHTLILCPPGRPWLPTGRPAEPHPVEVAVGVDEIPDILARVHDGSSLDVTRS